ncbi:MAG TPA: TonB-dependent receptor, partial [Cytophagales bacterium]|nr:TonB-dependent receptor [Cytophagales bacterium]
MRIPTITLFLTAILLAPLWGHAQAQSDNRSDQDSLVRLEEVTIQALGGYSADFNSPGGIGKLSPREFQAAPATTWVPILNTLAGVRLEERAPASYRVSIRGSSLRAPFGVRNVKIYWNGIPLTEANNTTALNLLDMGSIDQVEVLKRPAGSSFGAGTGGVINFTTLNPDAGVGVRASYTGGSWGTHHGRLQASWGNENQRIETRISHLQSQGYRDHSAVQRTVGQVGYQYVTQDQGAWSLHALGTLLDYQIPGGINAEQLADNPRQARPRSADQNSSIDQDRLLVNVGYQSSSKKSLRFQVNGFGYTGNFENPFILDYKVEDNSGGGLRAGAQWAVRPNWDLQLGTELQRSVDIAGNYGNVGGVRDTIRFADDIQTTQALAYLATQFRPWAGWEITGGLSLNSLEYNVTRTQNAFDPNHEIRTFIWEFPLVLAPRLAISRSWTNWVAHASINYGFSPPTLDEVRTNEGSLNTLLRPEQGWNYEVGLRWRNPMRERLAVNL